MGCWTITIKRRYHIQYAQHVSGINSVFQSPNLRDFKFQKRNKLNSIMHLQSKTIRVKLCASFWCASTYLVKHSHSDWRNSFLTAVVAICFQTTFIKLCNEAYCQFYLHLILWCCSSKMEYKKFTDSRHGQILGPEELKHTQYKLTKYNMAMRCNRSPGVQFDF